MSSGEKSQVVAEEASPSSTATLPALCAPPDVSVDPRGGDCYCIFYFNFLFRVPVFCLLTVLIVVVDSGLDVVLRKVGSIRPQGVATRWSVKAPWRSVDDTPQRSTLANCSKGAQRAAAPVAEATPSSLALGDSHETMMEQVEANVALLMVGKVPPIFGGLTTSTAAVAYPVFQEELPGLPYQGCPPRGCLNALSKRVSS